MAAHRYWRLFVLAANAFFGIGEIEFRGIAGGPTLLAGGTPSASSVYGSNTADKACDGTPTAWNTASNMVPLWWAYDFGVGVSHDIVEIAITAAADGSGPPTQWHLQWSDDGAAWSIAGGYYQTAWTVGGQQVFPVPVPAVDVPSAGTMLDPATLGPATTLSGGNLTATATSATFTGAKSTTAHSAGKLYFERSGLNGADDFVGICAQDATWDEFGNYAIKALGFLGNGSIYADGHAGLVPPGITVTYHPVAIAVDFDNWRAWIRGNGGTWGGSVSGADDPNVPATGIDIGFLRGSPVVAFVFTQTNGTAITFDFGASLFAGAMPAGYRAWDAPVVPTRSRAILLA